jgi:hypothetical protein
MELGIAGRAGGAVDEDVVEDVAAPLRFDDEVAAPFGITV